VIIESGAIYSTSSLIVVIIVVIRSTALYIAADSVCYIFLYALHSLANLFSTSSFPLRPFASILSSSARRVRVKALPSPQAMNAAQAARFRYASGIAAQEIWMTYQPSVH
jgi:hypothetical protein